MAELVDAIDLESISLRKSAGSTPADRIAVEPSPVYPMPKKKAPPKKRGPKPETFKIEGDWKEAVKRAMKRGKPAAKGAK